VIAIVVDSNSQMPDSLAERFGIRVVPLVVTVDGVDHLEGVELDADGFYSIWSDGATPLVQTSQSSPGSFAEAYGAAVELGASAILSIHVTAAMSGTLNSARLASNGVEVPIRIVDSGTASFGVSCCAWAAADAIESGASLDEAASVAERCAASLRTSFVVGVPQLTARSGRAGGLDVEAAAGEGVPVLAMSGGELSLLDTVADLDAAVDVMVADALAWPERVSAQLEGGLRVAIGTSDDSSRPVSSALTERLTGHPDVAEVVQYRIGPSVGAFTGPGTAGLFCF